MASAFSSTGAARSGSTNATFLWGVRPDSDTHATARDRQLQLLDHQQHAGRGVQDADAAPFPREPTRAEAKALVTKAMTLWQLIGVLTVAAVAIVLIVRLARKIPPKRTTYEKVIAEEYGTDDHPPFQRHLSNERITPTDARDSRPMQRGKEKPPRR